MPRISFTFRIKQERFWSGKPENSESATAVPLIPNRTRTCETAEMASQQANEMVREMANVLRERRIKIGASMNALAASSNLDRAALQRAEAGDRIPSLAFWVDWSDTLGVSLEKVMAEARKRVGKEVLQLRNNVLQRFFRTYLRHSDRTIHRNWYKENPLWRGSILSS